MQHAGDEFARASATNSVVGATQDNVLAKYKPVSNSLYALDRGAGKLMVSIIAPTG
jgi:hypothetical protein